MFEGMTLETFTWKGSAYEELKQELLRKEKEILEEFDASVYLDADILRQFGIEMFTDNMADYGTEYDALSYEREYMREREREARPRERNRARARYKAHCTRMTAHKARQMLRRRKYRGGANAGWW